MNGIGQLSDDDQDRAVSVDETTYVRRHGRLTGYRRTRIIAVETVAFQEATQGYVVATVKVHFHHPNHSKSKSNSN